MRGRYRRNELLLKQEKYRFQDTWAKLFSYAKPYIIVIIIALIAAVGGSFFIIIGPAKLAAMTDVITEGLVTNVDMVAVSKLAFTLASFYLISITLSFMQGLIIATVTQKIAQRLRQEIAIKINRLPLKYFDVTSYGDILSRVTNDVDTIGQTLNQSLVNLVAAITLFFGSLIMMFITNWIMALSAIISTFIGFLLMVFIISKSQKYFVAQQEYLGAVNGHIEEVYSGHNVVKAYNAEPQLRDKFQILNQNLYNNSWKAQFISGLMMPIMGFIGNLGYVVVSIIGAVLVLKGNITFGVIVAFMVYIRLFTQPLNQMVDAATYLQATSAASYRVFSLLNETELINENSKNLVLEKVKGDITFKNVEFGYQKDKKIINDFSVAIKAGQKIAIVGPTGVGKTTIVNLLMRFYELNKGEITIDGISIAKLTRENVHALFCMVLQETWLFAGTVKENIIYSKENIKEAEVIKVCKSIGLDHFINTLPNGYETILDEKTDIAEGQKQLITIARAMIKKAPMLILDEATSAVDTRTEVLIQTALDRLMEGKTAFIIAHRLSTIRNADLILVMNNGTIIESGNHQELLSKNGYYANLYNSQFEQNA